MKRNQYLILGLLALFACCNPEEIPTPPTPGGNDSIVTDKDTINWGDSIVITDSTDIASIDVTIDPNDDNSYTEFPEEVITDENHDDYGDFVENYHPTTHIVVTYDGETADVDTKPGVIAQVNGAHVTITSTKKNISFTLRGSTTNGSFKLNSEKKTLITLDNAHITNPTGAAINIQSGKTVMIALPNNTYNTLKDGENYEFVGEEQQKGALFSEGQLVFSGTGSLEVTSNYKHGIASDDYVRIREGHITINATGDGINAKERFIMYGGNVCITALQDGIDIDEGYIEIGGGILSVCSVDEAITASYEGDDDGNIDPLVTPYIDIRGGLIKLTTTGDKGHALRAMSTLTMSGGIVQATVKGDGSKALMSEEDMELSGGKITAFTEGAALYEADTDDLSSAAVIRSKSTLSITNMLIGAKSTGTGGKGINNVGDITMTNSFVTVLATGENHHHDAHDSHSRGITTDGNLTLDGGALLVKSYDTPLQIKGEQHFINDAIYKEYQLSASK